MSRWIYAELIRVNSSFSFTIFYTKDRRPPRELGSEGDLFIRENGNQLFYKTDTERRSIDGQSVNFPSRWRPVPFTNTPTPINHPSKPRYRLTGTPTRPNWMGTATKKTTDLRTSTAMYCHFKNKKYRSASPEL